MNLFRRGRILAVLTLMVLLASGAVQALPLPGEWTAPAGREPGLLGLLEQVFHLIWSANGGQLDPSGATSNGDNGGQLDPDGVKANDDNGGQLDPNG